MAGTGLPRRSAQRTSCGSSADRLAGCPGFIRCGFSGPGPPRRTGAAGRGLGDIPQHPERPVDPGVRAPPDAGQCGAEYPDSEPAGAHPGQSHCAELGGRPDARRQPFFDTRVARERHAFPAAGMVPGLDRLNAYPDLYACLYQDASCLEKWAAQQGDTFNYVYLDLTPAPGQAPQESALSVSLRQSGQYDLVYKTASVLIFAHR